MTLVFTLNDHVCYCQVECNLPNDVAHLRVIGVGERLLANVYKSSYNDHSAGAGGTCQAIRIVRFLEVFAEMENVKMDVKMDVKVDRPRLGLGYVRVSKQEGEKRKASLDAQQEAIRKYCEYNEIELVEIFEDAGISAESSLKKRSAGSKLCKALDSGVADNVIVTRPDRAFRNLVECLTVVEEWNNRGVRLHLIHFGGAALDTGAANGKMILSILAAIAQWEREIMGERIRETFAHKRSLGEHIGGKPPYGFRIEKGNKFFVPVEQEQAVIQDIRRLRYADGLSLRKIVGHLNKKGVPSRGKSWHLTTVSRILSREKDGD